MKILLYVVIGALVGQMAHAKSHVFQDCGVEISLPDSWKEQESGGWGHLFGTPENALGIRIHFKDPKDKTVWDILNETIKNFETRINDQEKPEIRQRVVAVSPFKAKSGLEGLRIITGSFDKEKKIRPGVYHYVFMNSAGRSVCACVYHRGSGFNAEQADEFILTSLKLITK